jgi:predicted DNA-binding protein (MmcQ/YjbR family)
MLNAQAPREHCLNQTGAVEEFPFGDEVRVFKVMGKMFALMPAAGPTSISLKCNPVLAKMQRDTYPAVQPGYHLNKQHWNTVRIDGSIPDAEILEMVDHSYQLVVKGLKKADQERLSALKHDR